MIMTTTKDSLQVITLDDPAIDVFNSDLVEYSKTRNLESLKLNEGMLPVIFKMKRLSTDMLLRLRDYSKGDKVTHHYLCFLASCNEYSIGDEITKATLISNTSLAEDSWLDKLREEFGMQAVEELVMVAHKLQTHSRRNPFFI